MPKMSREEREKAYKRLAAQFKSYCFLGMTEEREILIYPGGASADIMKMFAVALPVLYAAWEDQLKKINIPQEVTWENFMLELGAMAQMHHKNGEINRLAHEYAKEQH